MPRPRAAILTKTCVRTECGATFTTPDKVHFREKRYCSRTCANRDVTEAREQVRGVGSLGYTPPVCPCGKDVPPAPGQKYVYGDNKKYCSAECRKRYGGKRQADPANHVTFDCETCGKTTTKRRSIGNQNRFCSVACANKHTKTVRHYVVRDMDMVLDSGWEMLFAGLCYLHKVEVKRVDRATVVELGPSNHYAPDFYLPAIEAWIEVKGQPSAEAEQRWTAWREQRGPLAAVMRHEVDELRKADSARDLLGLLKGYASAGVA